MHELDWGSFDDQPIFADGHPWDIADEMARQGIGLNSPDWRTDPYFARNRVVQSVKNVEDGIDSWLSEHGYHRSGLYYEHDREEDRHRTIALFSHGGSSCAAIGHILDLPFPYMCALLHIEFTGITILRMDRRAGIGTLPCLELANDGRHIREGHYHRLVEK
jgi:probable phosphoglycerate mutase